MTCKSTINVPSCLATSLALAALLAFPALGQYPGQLSKASKPAPEMRAIAVLEWTGEAGKPAKSRLVPVAVLDGGQLQDGGLYLARPQPMALDGGVEYELQQNGRPMGLFDVEHAGQEQGSWVAYGAWKQMPAPKPGPSMAELARLTGNDEDSDRPLLHRKHSAGKAPGAGKPDRPKGEPAPPADPDRPTLHKKSSTDDSAASAPPADDPDRPRLKKPRQKPQDDIGNAESLPGVTDPDRPLLKRGKSSSDYLKVAPSLMGLPPEMQQAVAVSDARSHPEHPWNYNWANPEDESKMKSALEDLARQALGLLPPPPPPAPKHAPAKKKAEPPPPPPKPAPLDDEQFRVFELAYGSGATMVLSAHSPAPAAQQKFVTIVAQPDLYGEVMVLLKSVTDFPHLDETPRMRLVDAVDALADNRGELLFELRGQTQRQFALYRVLRGQAEKLYVSSGGLFGSSTSE